MINHLKKVKDAFPANPYDYSPKYYRLSSKADKIRLGQLLGENNQIVVHDHIQGQVRELIKLRHPATVLDKPSMDKEVEAYKNGMEWEEIGVWVYYPWGRNLVHLLDREEFIEVRTSRNLYKITREEQAELAKKRIGVVGLSVGQSVAITLSMERTFGELRLADFDELELSNLNRIRSGVQNLGIPKVVMAAREIAEIDPFLKVSIFKEGLTEGNMETFLTSGGKLDVLVDECDSLPMKIKMRQQARQLRIPVLMDTSDRGMLDVERYDLEPGLPLFHGRLEHLDLSNIDNITAEERMNFLFAIIDIGNVSDRTKTSLAEIGKTITTWPQLASSVIMGGGVCGEVCRRILLGQSKVSGRFYVDVEKLIS